MGTFTVARAVLNHRPLESRQPDAFEDKAVPIKISYSPEGASSKNPTFLTAMGWPTFCSSSVSLEILESEVIRFKIVGAIAALFLSVAAAQATPITIDYTLAPASGGSLAGTMELVLSAAPSLTQPTNYSSLISAGSRVMFGTEVFALTSSTVTLLKFNSLSPNYSLHIVSLPYIHDTNGAGGLTMSSIFVYQSANGALNEAGGFSNGVVRAQAAVPEPLTLSLFSAGLFGAGVMRRRQNKKTVAV